MALNYSGVAFNYLIKFLKPYRLALGLNCMALIAAAIAVISLGIGLRHLIDRGLATHDFNLLNRSLLFMGILVCIVAVASFCRAYLSAWAGEQVIADIRQDSFNRFLCANISFYDETESGELISRLYSDTTLIQTFIGGAASTGLRSLIQFIGALLMIFIISLKLALLLCLVIPLTFLPLLIYGKRVKYYAQASQSQIARLTSLSQEVLSAPLTIQAYGNEEKYQNYFQNLLGDVLKASHQRILVRSLLSSTVILMAFLSVSLILWVGGRQVFIGTMSSGELLAFVFYALLAAGSINSIGEVLADWQRASTACEDLITLLKQAKTCEKNKPGRSITFSSWEKIIFNQINFHYPRQPGISVLKNVSLIIERGEKIALVGPSGAGKSTLFKLLLRFYDPQQGSIYFDTSNLHDFNLQDLRQTIGWVGQEPILFAGSVYDNIRFGKPDASNKEIEEAAYIACAYDFIKALPRQFETPLNEGGLSLSGGQRQRIAIARAIVRNPDILLLDEATNSLDAESEAQIQKAIDQLMQERTVLMVTHRLSTALKADRIIVFDQGTVIANGTHKHLMQESLLYQRLATLQLSQGSLSPKDNFKGF